MAKTADRTGDDEIEVWRLLLVTQAGALRRIEADLKAAGAVPLNWYDVLLELARAPAHRLRMADLGERVVLSRTRVSRLVDELVRAGLVERLPDPDDGRAAFAVLTEAGADAQRAAAPVYLRGIRDHFTDFLIPQERRAMITGLTRVAEGHREET